MNIPAKLLIAITALTFSTTFPSVQAATIAGAGIEHNGKYVGGYAITWDGESREDLVRQLSKFHITFERDFEIPIDAKDPTMATLKGKVRLLSNIRGDREVMATAGVLQLVKREGKWYAEPESLEQALKDLAPQEKPDPSRWPAGTIMAADESNATHRMTLTFSIKGQGGDHEYEYLFRVLDEPSNLVVSLPASGAHGDGEGGGFSLYVLPNLDSEKNHVSFEISFKETRDDKETSVEESIEVPLLKEDSGQVGLIKYKTAWKAKKGGADPPATAGESKAAGKENSEPSPKPRSQ